MYIYIYIMPQEYLYPHEWAVHERVKKAIDEDADVGKHDERLGSTSHFATSLMDAQRLNSRLCCYIRQIRTYIHVFDGWLCLKKIRG